MNMLCKIFYIATAALFSTSAFALLNRLDILASGGYSQADTFSDTTFNNNTSPMTGFNAGGMVLVAPTDRLITPVMGLGAQYLQVKSTITDTTNAYKYVNTLTSTVGTGHLGLRLTAPMLRLFVIGNVGYGLSDKFTSELNTLGGTTVSTTDYKLKNHIFYGGTAALLIKLAPFIRVGLGGEYNMHSASFENTATSVATDLTYQQASVNLYLNINI